jgi:DNA-binding transcriptional MerR regulator
MPDGCVNGPDAAREAGITYRQLDYWTRRGYLEAERPGQGSGRDRLYNRSEIAIAKMAEAFRRAGLRLDVAFRTARELQDRPVVRIMTGAASVWVVSTA